MLNEIEKKVLEKIIPSTDDRKKINEVVKELKKQVEQEIQERKIDAYIEIVGSIEKDTFLNDNLDIDLFLVFPKKNQKKILADSSLSIGRKILKNTEECFAEHPYIRGFFKDYKVEIVPCYKIEVASQKLSAVDRTPLHTEFIKENLKEYQRQEVRLFKQFLKGIGCYGAEAEIEGFSGYLCEILILEYGDFKNLIKNAKNWKFGEKLALKKEEYPSFDTPLIFIDPVDSERNVASAVSEKKFNLFVKACNKYLIKPSIKFFFPNKIKPWQLDKIRKKIESDEKKYVGILIKKPDIIDENLYPQIRKAARSISDFCTRNDFTIYDTDYYVDESKVIIVFKTNEEPLLKTKIHTGPPAKMKKNVKGFIEKWKNNPIVIKNPYEKNERLYVEIKREYIIIEELLQDEVKNLSLGKHIDKIKDDYKIVQLDGLLCDDLRIFWTRYLDEKMPWER